MLNYQFFGTAGIITGILAFIGIVMAILSGIAYDNWWYYKTEHIFIGVAIGCLSIIALFWLVMGVVTGLDSLYNWGIIAK